MRQPDFDISTDFVSRGVELCWKNANSLVAEAELLRANGFYARALSLSILALEELGKLMSVDGLAFSVACDEVGKERKALFEKCLSSHFAKLRVLDGYPLCLDYLARLDPRYNTEARFRTMIAIVVEGYRKDRLELARWIGEDCDLEKLNEIKKGGFYVSTKNADIVSPLEVDRALVEAVFRLARDMVDGFDFILKHNLERYRDFITSVRNSVTKQDLEALRRLGQRISDRIFRSD